MNWSDSLPAMLFGALAAIAAVLILGRARWRALFRIFAIPEHRMTVKSLGLAVHTPEHLDKVAGVLTHFAGGFNAMITGRSFEDWKRYCNGLPAFFQPFAHEGAAMGYPLRYLGRYRPQAFEADVVRAYPQFRYLYYVGLGFWGAMRGYSPRRMEKLTRGLDPLYRYLCYDGYGFKHGLFDYRRTNDPFRPLMLLEGYARRAAYQGVGRSMYFHYMDEPDELVARLHDFNEYALDVASGVGLASVFINPDRLEIACDLASRMEEVWHPAVHQGMCFGLKARYINDVEQFEQDMSRLPLTMQEAIFTSIRECDRIELQVRDDGEDNAYRLWREHLAAWMTYHVEYPFVSYRSPARRLAP